MERLADTDISITTVGLQCPTCGEVVVSLHRHDFCQCGCGNIFIDGGFDYMRAGSKEGMAKAVTIRINRDCLHNRVLEGRKI